MSLIRREPDPAIQAIVATWPERFDAAHATALGFQADRDFAAIVETYRRDELGLA